MGDNTSSVPSRLYHASHQPSITDLKKTCSSTITKADLPLASSIEKNIPIYALQPTLPSIDHLTALQDEWHHTLLSGPGVFIVKNLYRNTSLIDRINSIFASIIESEAARGDAAGDHFASSGKNSRIWNSFSKHCILDPSSFAEYYSNPWLSAICEAWLGPGYRITAQVNIVHPGGAAQSCHRDYHLGFQNRDGVRRFPRVMQVASQMLTLQGAVAHSDMPIESGPTRLLPFSQLVEDGYMTFRDPEVQNFFEANYVALPLSKGDGLFFNPALFHAAGENTTRKFSRSANLLQISSAFGKAMESIDTMGLIEKCWDILVEKYRREGVSGELKALVKAVAEGYPFPTNLDRSPPDPKTMAPVSEQELMLRLLEQGLEKDEAMSQLRDLRAARDA